MRATNLSAYWYEKIQVKHVQRVSERVTNGQHSYLNTTLSVHAWFLGGFLESHLRFRRCYSSTKLSMIRSQRQGTGRDGGNPFQQWLFVQRFDLLIVEDRPVHVAGNPSSLRSSQEHLIDSSALSFYFTIYIYSFHNSLQYICILLPFLLFSPNNSGLDGSPGYRHVYWLGRWKYPLPSG